MSTSITVRRYLETQDVRFTIITCPVDAEGRWQGDVGEISPSCVARAMILKDSSGMVMAVLPITHRLKLDALNRQLHRKLLQAEEIDYRGVFADCSPGILPALGEAYSFETVIDDSLLDQDYVYIASGNAGELIQITGQDFQLLHSNAWYGNTFSQIAEKRPTQKPADLKYQQQIKQQAERKVKKVVEVVEKNQRLPQCLLPICVSVLNALRICPQCHR